MTVRPDFRNAIRFGDAADALSRRSGPIDCQDANVAMNMFCAALFRGEFDGPVLFQRTKSKRRVPQQVARTLKVPFFAGVRAGWDSEKNVASLFHGLISGDHRDVVYLAFEFGIGTLPETGPISENDWNEAATALSETEFEDFPEAVQALLRCVLIARPKLDLWLAERGIELPHSAASPDTEVTVPASTNERSERNAAEDGRRGRPGLASWPRIRELVRELHAVDPKRYHKCLAQDVRKLIAGEFDERDIPTASTIQSRIPDLLGNRLLG